MLPYKEYPCKGLIGGSFCGWGEEFVLGWRRAKIDASWYNINIMGHVFSLELKELREKFRANWRLVEAEVREKHVPVSKVQTKVVREETEPHAVLSKLIRVYAKLVRMGKKI